SSLERAPCRFPPGSRALRQAVADSVPVYSPCCSIPDKSTDDLQEPTRSRQVFVPPEPRTSGECTYSANDPFLCHSTLQAIDVAPPLPEMRSRKCAAQGLRRSSLIESGGGGP